MNKRTSAFTLIELLVVITIIAILASIAFPVFNTVTERANQTKDLSNIRQIGVGLKLFAADHNGSFPTKVDPANPASADIANANEAFRNLFPNYLTDEQIFAVKSSAWTPNTPDNRIDPNGFPYAQTLVAGENSYAYIVGLTETSNAAIPVVADGFANPVPAPPQYDTNRINVGGVWAGKRAVVLNCDGSVNNLVCNATMVAPARTSSAGAQVNLFDVDNDWLTAANTVFNPLTPP